MPKTDHASDDLLQPGFMAIHGNRLEDLRDLTAQWLAHAPLAPLENEVVLVQSNGIAQWFKQALARPFGGGGLGISAAVEVQLPGQFLWSAYRAVLGHSTAIAHSPFDPERLVWRLLRLLPELIDREGFEPLRRYLGDDDDGRKRHQLAQRLADLYDQYQVHRADWLQDWEQQRDRLADPWRDRSIALPPGQLWQAELWRRLLDDVGPQQRHSHRAAVHHDFLARCQQLVQRPSGLPRRIVVFGISSLPLQTLEALAALGTLCQVLLVVMNPCRQYWADIVEDRELLRAERQRNGSATGVDVTASAAVGHPLLAAWGRQGRDYIRLLDRFDNPDDYRQRFVPLTRSIDIYDDPGETTLLRQLQQDILDLSQPPPGEQHVLPAQDRSIRFHVTHGAQREVEILHDRLLALRDLAERDGAPLQPRDILVMVPDVQTHAAHIEAVFGAIDRDDPRYLPYAIADRGTRGQASLVVALEALLALPDLRCSVSDLMTLLDAPALRRRFDLGEDELPVLRRWIHESGVRWGLHARQRASLGVAVGEQNSWAFGLRRMLLGYAVGDGAAWNDVDPYGEVGGLDARHVGAMATLLERVDQWWRMLAQPHSPQDWARRLRELLRDAFDAGDDADDALRLERLNDALDDWSEACADAALVEPISRAVVDEAWLAAIDQPRLSQRFGGGAVNFATLMPMRAIPFRVVCLLGMNDGDYPRTRPALEFDLMALPGSQRPGDRSRRDDDRYLFLEALLSAREHLHISWVGRSARDNQPRPPSVLVGQLRDHLDAAWRCDDGSSLLDVLTIEHPLQPFARACFDVTQPRHFSYAREWRQALQPSATAARSELPLADPVDAAPITMAGLRGLLRRPVRQFFNARLKVYLDGANDIADELEPFAMDGLQRWGVGAALLHSAQLADDDATDAAIQRAVQQLRGAGQLPLHRLATVEVDRLADQVRSVHRRWQAERSRFPIALPPQEVRISHAGVVLEDWIEGLRGDAAGNRLRLHAIADGLTDRAADPRPRWHRLLGAWVEHLASHADGSATETRIIAADCLIVLSALPAATARAEMQALLEAWRGGMNAPLALACRTGFAWLEAQRRLDLGKKAEPVEAAQKAYESELAGDAYLQRVWPDFPSLRMHGLEDELAIYAGLFQHARISGVRA